MARARCACSAPDNCSTSDSRGRSTALGFTVRSVPRGGQLMGETSMSDSTRPRTRALCVIVALLSGAVATGAQSAAPLASYNVDRTQVSVSGLSSGGFFAVQLGVSYSSVFKGVGIFAGGTYDCAGQSNYT